MLLFILGKAEIGKSAVYVVYSVKRNGGPGK